MHKIDAQMHEINAHFERPAPEVIQRISTQHVGVIGAALGPRQVSHPDIKPLNDEWRICGPALTIRPQFWDDRLIAELAPKYAKPGDVIVIDAGGHTESAVWGMSMSRSALWAGAAGVVIDGSCMNSALLAREQPQIPIFARGISPTTREPEHPGSINVPVVCGGVIVNPGDVVLADSDGVVFVPSAFAEAAIASCERHDKQAKQDRVDQVTLFERYGTEEKLRKHASIKWNE